MDLERARTALVEQYVSAGYTQLRAEAVIDAAICIHKAALEQRSTLAREGVSALAPGIERSDCLSTVLSLEMQHAHEMLHQLHGRPSLQ
jgi:hypothetical protein